MPSKPPKLVITVSGPMDSGKTHLLIKLQEFLVQTYGSEVRIKTDTLLLSRYDGHEHGPARPHRGSEIELRSETVSPIKLVMDPNQPGVSPELIIHSMEHRLTVYRDTQRVYAVHGIARKLVANLDLLPPDARAWAIAALDGSPEEYRKEVTPPPVPKEEPPVTKLFQPRRSWLSRLKGFLLGKPQTSFTLEELKVTPDAPREQMRTAPVGEAFVENVSEPRRVPTGVEPHYGAASHKLKPAATSDDFTMVPGERNEIHELINRLDANELADRALQPPIEVDDYTLTVDDGQLTVNELLMEEVTPEVDPHAVEAATQDVIDRLGGIVPHHHGHARKIMPLEGPTGKKSNFNVRNQKPHGKKKPRR